MFNPNIILASGSQARSTMMKNVGYDFTIQPTDIDEQSLIQNLQKDNVSFEKIAMTLGQEKARALKNNEDSYIIGSDQLLIFKDTIFSKSENLEQAHKKLSSLQGQTHHLISGVSVIKNGQILWSDFDVAEMIMKKLSDNDIKEYLSIAANDAIQCVGGYAIEGYGGRLFKEIKGDLFTIMGMPLLKLSQFFDCENDK